MATMYPRELEQEDVKSMAELEVFEALERQLEAVACVPFRVVDPPRPRGGGEGR